MGTDQECYRSSEEWTDSLTTDSHYSGSGLITDIYCGPGHSHAASTETGGHRPASSFYFLLLRSPTKTRAPAAAAVVVVVDTAVFVDCCIFFNLVWALHGHK